MHFELVSSFGGDGAIFGHVDSIDDEVGYSLCSGERGNDERQQRDNDAK